MLDLESRPQLKEGCYLKMSEHAAFLIYEVGYGSSYKVRLPLISALIINCMTGEKTLNEILRFLSCLFPDLSTNLSHIVESIINRMGDFICYGSPSSINPSKISMEEIIRKTSPYTTDDLKVHQKGSPTKEIVYMASPTCNYQCIYCYANMHFEQSLDFLPLARWRTVLEEAKDYGCSKVFISGGDPFLNPNLIQYINIASDIGYEITVSTREALSANTIDELVHAGLNVLQVSIDATEREIVSFLTGVEDGYDRAMTTIDFARKAGLSIKSKSVITRYNIENIPLLIDALCALGCKVISLNHYSASAGRHRKDLYPTPEMLHVLDNVLFEKQLKYAGKVDIEYEYGRAALMELGSRTMGLLRKRCNACVDTLIINYDGSVYYCEYLMNDKRFIIGDLRTSNLMEIWKSNKISELHHPDRRLFESSKCFNCAKFDTCNNFRCYLRSQIAFNNPFELDPWCPYSNFDGVIL